jgi:hypothetical protein
VTTRGLSLLPVLLFGGILGAVLPASPLWFLVPPLFIAFLAVLVFGRRRGDHEFPALCIGELLVALAGAGLPWSALPIQCLLVGVILAELGLLGSLRDLLQFGAYAGLACASLALVLLPRNLLVSGLVAAGLFLVLYLGLAVGEHEERRALSGGAP